MTTLLQNMHTVTSQMITLRYTIFALSVGLAFSYGFLVGKHEVFPYKQLKTVKNLVTLKDAPLFSFDQHKRLVEFANKTEVPCPPQTGKTGVLLVIGQSNAANSAEKRVATRFPERNLNYFDGRCYVSESPLLGATNEYGEWITLVGDHLIEQGVYENVLLVSSAIGSSSITLWAEDGDLNHMLVSTIQELSGHYHVTDVIWHQGETDATTFTHTSTYVRMFESMMDTLATVGVTGPYYMSIASLCFDLDVVYPNKITRAQQELIDKHDNIVLGVNTDEIVPRVDRYDDCHFGEKAQQLVAAELASAIGRNRPLVMGKDAVTDSAAR